MSVISNLSSAYKTTFNFLADHKEVSATATGIAAAAIFATCYPAAFAAIGLSALGAGYLVYQQSKATESETDDLIERYTSGQMTEEEKEECLLFLAEKLTDSKGETPLKDYLILKSICNEFTNGNWIDQYLQLVEMEETNFENHSPEDVKKLIEKTKCFQIISLFTETREEHEDTKKLIAELTEKANQFLSNTP